MRFVWIFAACGLLAACGADGEPIKPSYSAGVSVGSPGVKTRAGVRFGKGPVSVRIGL